MFHETISPLLPGFESYLVSYARPRTGSLADTGRRWAVIICPGGGYQVVAPTEGEPVALDFLAAGVQAFVLHYSVAPVRYPAQLRELAAAVAYVRASREKYGIDRVAVCGFSAGGHLAGCLANLWAAPELADLGRPEELRPDAAILGYPVISARDFGKPAASFYHLLGAIGGESQPQLSLETSVTAGNPPTFLWATATDQMVPVENTLLYAGALRQAGIPLELHIFRSGPHAMAAATDECAMGPSYRSAHIAGWLPLAAEWLAELPGKVC